MIPRTEHVQTLALVVAAIAGSAGAYIGVNTLKNIERQTEAVIQQVESLQITSENSTAALEKQSDALSVQTEAVSYERLLTFLSLNEKLAPDYRIGQSEQFIGKREHGPETSDNTIVKKTKIHNTGANDLVIAEAMSNVIVSCSTGDMLQTDFPGNDGQNFGDKLQEVNVAIPAGDSDYHSVFVDLDESPDRKQLMSNSEAKYVVEFYRYVSTPLSARLADKFSSEDLLEKAASIISFRSEGHLARPFTKTLRSHAWLEFKDGELREASPDGCSVSDVEKIRSERESFQ